MAKTTMTPKEATKFLGKANTQGVREALKQGRAPYGYAIENPGGKWSYIISRAKFFKFLGIQDPEVQA